MRKLLLAVLIAASTYGLAKAQTNYQYGPTYETNYNYQGQPHLLGQNASSQGFASYILFLNWQWTFSQIPTSAVIKSINIRFEARSETYSTRTLPFTLHFIQSNWIDFGSSDLYSELNNNYNSDSLTQVLSASIVSDANGIAEYNGTFTSGALLDSVQAAVSGGRDYITIAVRSEDGSAPWWEIFPYECNTNVYYDSTNTQCVALTINYQASTQTYQFSNEIEGTTNYGSLNLKDDQTGAVSPVNSGNSVGLSPANTYSATTAELPFLANWNGSGYTEKHQDWDVNSQPNYVLTYDLHPDLSKISSSLLAQFSRTYPVTIQNYLLEGGTAGNVGFDDPWRYYQDSQGNWLQSNQTIEYSSPLSIQNGSGSYGGVILDQSYNVPGKPYYSVSVPATQTATIDGASHTLYFQNWSASGATLENPKSTQTPVVFNSSSATVTANVKATQLSNDASAFSNNGQRRLIETTSGGETWLTEVYTDGGHVWMEHSSDGGNTWILGNNGKPLDGTAGGKDPSIAFTTSANPYILHNYIGVVWMQPSGSTYSIVGQTFTQSSSAAEVPIPALPVQTLFTEPSGGDAYSVDAGPNLTLAGGETGSYLVTFDQKSASGGYQPGVNWLVGNIQDSGTQQDGPFGLPMANGVVSGTNANSTDFQMSPYPGYNNNTDVTVNYIYREGSPAGTIYSGNLVVYYISQVSSWLTTGVSFGMISYNAAINLSPSIVSLSNSDTYAACWLEYNTLVFWNQGQSVRNYYGTDDAQSCSINIGGTDTSSSGFVAWSTDYNGGWANNSMRFNDGSPNSSTMQTLNTSGEYVEVGNGASTNSDLSKMYVSSFYPFTSPYTFKTSGTLAPLSKASPQLSKGPALTVASAGAGPQLVEGRGFMIKKGDVSFTYRFGDLNVDGKNIGFVSAPDTADYGDPNVLNSALETRPFQVNAGSRVVFTERSGFADSASAVSTLGKHDYIGYKVEVVDNSTGDVLGTISKNSITSLSVHPLKTTSYQLNTAGLAGKTLRVKIAVSTDLPAYSAETALNVPDSLPARIKAEIARLRAPHSNIFLIKSFARHNQALAEVAANGLSMLNLQVPKTFSLFQNYPNPFNPTTVIEYTIPKDSHVTLKVYDVLGQEVETLVNEDQNIGRYEVQFNGSRLASGVYFYRLVAGSHVITKKMLLIK